jgi:hypothetical protein
MGNNTIPPYQEGSQTGAIDRSTQMRRDTDTVTTPKISLYDIDYSVFYHLNNTLQLKVTHNGNSISVPCMFSNAETWSQIQRNGVIRDEQRKLMSPLIVIKRLDYADDDRLPIVGLNNYSPQLKIYPYRSLNMQYDKVAGQFATKESHEYYLISSPTYIRVNYDIIIWTDYTEQMNDVLQNIYSTQDNMWGDFWKFRTHISNVSHDTSNMPGEDRVVKTTLSITVDGMLIPEYQYNDANLQKQFTIKRVKFMSEKEESVLYEGTYNSNNPNDSLISDQPKSEIQNTFRRDVRYKL